METELKVPYRRRRGRMLPLRQPKASYEKSNEASKHGGRTDHQRGSSLHRYAEPFRQRRAVGDAMDGARPACRRHAHGTEPRAHDFYAVHHAGNARQAARAMAALFSTLAPGDPRAATAPATRSSP